MPNTLSANVPSIFSIDIDYSTTNGLNLYNSVIDSLNLIYQTQQISLWYSPFNMIFPSTTNNDYKYHITGILDIANTGYYNAYYSPDTNGFNQIIIGRGVESGIDFLGVDGMSFHENLSGIILHELTHALLTPTNLPYSNHYREETTVFLTNFMEASASSTNERVGHSGGTGAPSVSAIEYLAGLSLVNLDRGLADSAANPTVTFEFQDQTADINKTYYALNTDGLDHLITIDALYAAVIGTNGALYDGRLGLIIDSSVIEESGSKLTALYNAQQDLSEILSDIAGISNPNMQLNFISPILNNFVNYHPTNLLTISAEHFIDADAYHNTPDWTLNVQGPVIAGGSETLDAPSILTLRAKDSASDAGYLVFGGGGFTASPLTGVGAFHLGNTVDHLIGGSGDDVLIAGGGVSLTEDRNIIDGGAGNNILIGNITHSDAVSTLIGKAGNNLFVSGAAADYLIGSTSGFQVADYTGSGAAVTIDLRTKSELTYSDLSGPQQVDAYTGKDGDAEGDRYYAVSTFIGSDFADTFYGATSGSPHLFIGGDGDDIFHLSSGDTAIGGTGSDTFYIDTMTNSYNTYFLIGVDQDDKIYIDGQLYTGRVRVMASDGATSNGYPGEHGYVVSDTSAYGITYGTPSGFNSELVPLDATKWDTLHLGRINGGQGSLNGFGAISFTDTITGHYTNLFMAGFEMGDAGITQSLDNPLYDTTNGTTVSIVHSDGNTPGVVYDGAYEAWASFTDYTFLGHELLLV